MPQEPHYFNSGSSQKIDEEKAKEILYMRGNRGKEIFGENIDKKTRKKVNEIKRCILTGRIIPAILVENTTKECMDGNHRLMAVRELWSEGYKDIKLPTVYCTVMPKEGQTIEQTVMEQTRAINSKADKWKISEFIKSDAIWDTNAEDLVNFCKSHETICTTKNGDISFRIAKALLTGKDGTGFKAGVYKPITPQMISNAEEIISEISQINNKREEYLLNPAKRKDKNPENIVGTFPIKPNEKFVIAWCWLRNQTTFHDMGGFNTFLANISKFEYETALASVEAYKSKFNSIVTDIRNSQAY